MNVLVTHTLSDLKPAGLQTPGGPVRALFLSIDVLGWTTSSHQLIEATKDRADIAATHVLLRPPLLMRVLNRRLFGGHHLVMPTRTWDLYLRRWVRTMAGFDVIHCNPQMLANALAKKKHRHGYKLSMSCDTTVRQHDRELSNLKARKDVSEEPLVFGVADLILPLSRWCATSLVDEYGVDPAKLLLTRPSAPVPADVPAREPRARRMLRIAFVGNDFARKGGPKLLKWHQDRWADRVELHVASAEAADHAPAKNVTWHGRLGRDAVLSLLEKSDLLVHPTQADMSALVVAEAQSRGVPAVASRLAGIPDLLEDGVTGLLVDPADDAGFISAVESILFDEARHTAMSAAARRFAQQHLDSPVVYRRVIDRLIGLVRPEAATADRT